MSLGGRLGASLLSVLVAAGLPGATSSDKKCTEEVDEGMSSLRAGDSGARNMLRLAQALECVGKPEDALGATYFASRVDTTGWNDLLLYRIHLFRSFGMDDQAKRIEDELGLVSESAPRPWYFEPRPQLGGSIGWVGQTDNPIQGGLAAQYRRWNATDGSWIGTPGVASVGPMDTVFLEGTLLSLASYAAWGGFSDNASVMGFVSWDAAIASTLDQWRSQSLSVSLQGDRALGPLFTLGISSSAMRTWYPAEGELVADDEFNLGPSMSLKTSPGTFSLANNFRVVRADGPWMWSGTHNASWSRTFARLVVPTATGTLAWGIDPASTTTQEIPVVILQAKGIQSGVSVSSVTLLDTLGRPVGELRQAMQQKYPQPLVARESEVVLPLYTNADWIQGGFSLGLGLGRWKGLSARFAAGWSRTFYLRQQGGTNLSLDAIHGDTSGHWVLYQDPATRELFATSSYTLSGLIPLTWSKRRRDDTWSFSAGLTWKARKWLSFQATWTSTHTTSNVEDWLDGASSNKETVSLGSALSW